MKAQGASSFNRDHCIRGYVVDWLDTLYLKYCFNYCVFFTVYSEKCVIISFYYK